MSVLVGRKAPLFRATAVVNGSEIIPDFSLETYADKKYVLFFFYPADFSAVCPTEILAFQERMAEFDERNVAVVGCSGDSQFVHQKWLSIPVKQGGIEGVKYPLVADSAKTIMQLYDVLAGDYLYNAEGEVSFEGPAMAYRGSFLIDKAGIVRHQVVNDLPLSRSIDETLRMIDALQHFEEYGEACPIDWHKGDKGIK
ncbi:peroxiredoxin [uncultured Rikenella sp.]|uniref:peroxiredoxin n=1 Tax=uncultured Rikenella sp. TaxID=368003 RepID=UPI0025D2B71E|nr:peroxiredoxin [uncultured Rikenella sp.]